MKGRDDILRVRRAGLKPRAVFLCDYRNPFPKWSVEQQISDGGLPALYIDQDDPGTTDCRFLVGLHVHLDCAEMSRAVQWVDRLLQDGVARIYQFTDGEVTQWQ